MKHFYFLIFIHSSLSRMIFCTSMTQDEMIAPGSPIRVCSPHHSDMSISQLVHYWSRVQPLVEMDHLENHEDSPFREKRWTFLCSFNKLWGLCQPCHWKEMENQLLGLKKVYLTKLAMFCNSLYHLWRAGKIAPWLRAVVAIDEDQHSVPSTHIVDHNQPQIQFQEILNSPSSIDTSTYVAHIPTC